MWQILVKKFVASLTLHFILAKSLFRDLSESISKLVEHHAQSPVRECMLAVWPSITEGFPTDVHVIYTINVTNTCEIVCGKSDPVFHLGQETLVTFFFTMLPEYEFMPWNSADFLMLPEYESCNEILIFKFTHWKSLVFFLIINFVFAVVSFPRVKSFSLEEMGLTMEIPRVLAIGNVAIRVMYTKYDHLSPLSKSFYPKIKVKPPEVVVDEAPTAEEKDADGVMFCCYNSPQLVLLSFKLGMKWCDSYSIAYTPVYICYLLAGRSVWWKTVIEVFKMLPEATGWGQDFQVWGHSFSIYGPTLSR